MLNKLFHDTGTLIKFTFKRERISTPIWIICIVALTLIVGAVLPTLYTSGVDRQVMAETMKNPAMVAMLGPAYGADNYTNGAMMSQMMLLFTIIGVALMNIFLVVRHTRKDEEEGRVELVRSLPVGRLSNLTAIIVVAIIANLIIAVLTGLGLFALKIESMDLAGSLMYGAVLGVSGILFAGITALFCQLASTSRGANGYSFAFLGLMYLIQMGRSKQSSIILYFTTYIGYESTGVCCKLYLANISNIIVSGDIFISSI